MGAHDTTIDHVVAADNGVAGFTSIATSGDRYLDDTACNNGLAGIQVAESSGPGHKLQDVVAYANHYGLFVLSVPPEASSTPTCTTLPGRPVPRPPHPTGR